MKHLGLVVAGGLAVSAVGLVTAFAGDSAAAAAVQVRAAKFTVANMTCATCPIAVKKAMSEVTGVRSVRMDFSAKTATVVFDPSKTSAAQIAAASDGIGFPAKLAR